VNYISVSQLNLYRTCSLKYRFTYIDKLPKLFKSSALAFGAAVHSTIEWLHKEQMKGREVSLEALHKIFSIDWYSQKVDTEIHYKHGEMELELVDKGKGLLTLYYDEGPREVTGSEVPFKVPLVDLSTGEVLDIPIMGYMRKLPCQEDSSKVEFPAIWVA